MNSPSAKTSKGLIIPVATPVIVLALGAWFFLLAHERLAHLAIVAVGLSIYSLWGLFCWGIPARIFPKALFASGIVLTLLMGLAAQSISGVIVGALVAAVGFLLLKFQQRRD